MRNLSASLLLGVLLTFTVAPLAPARKAALVTPATAHAREPRPRFEASPFTRSELFFGRGKPDGSMVTDDEWQRFLDTEVTPRFPDGLTTIFGDGQFRAADGTIVREGSILLILLYPRGEKDASARLEAIRDAYKRAFQQESVLRVDDPARVGF
jgi:hypothetical protein